MYERSGLCDEDYGNLGENSRVVGQKTIRDLTDRSGTKEAKIFTYRNPFGLHFKYRHKVDDHKNHIHTPIYLDRTWSTKFWKGCNFSWYLVASEVNIDLESGHF